MKVGKEDTFEPDFVRTQSEFRILIFRIKGLDLLRI